MKRIPLILVAATVALGVTVAAMADFTPPTDAQIEGLLADTTQLESLIKDATPAQIADVVLKAIAKAEASTELTDAQKKQVIVLLSARATVLSGPSAPEVIALVAKDCSATALPVVVAAAAVASGKQSDSIVNAVVAALGADSPEATVARNAARDPGGTLGTALMQLIRQIVPGGPINPGGGGGPLRTPGVRYPGQQ